MNLEALKASLEQHEGKKRLMYKDTNGHWTIGIGRNLEKGISDAIIDQLFHEDIAEAQLEADRAFPGWQTHSDARQNVVLELIFNMGAPVLSGFKKFWAAMDARDYSQAALELTNSQWAIQVKGRAVVLADRLARDLLQ